LVAEVTGKVVDGFILAAGEGRRLRPASLSCPKALVPFCGVSLLELVASQLTRLTLNRVVVNCCSRGDRVADATARLRNSFGWNLRVSQEDRLLNTGGGIRQGVELLPHGEHLIVHNVDVVLDVDLRGNNPPISQIIHRLTYSRMRSIPAPCS